MPKGPSISLQSMWKGCGSHWRGEAGNAAPGTGMVHVAIQEALDGKHVDWPEHVSDEQYNAKVG